MSENERGNMLEDNHTITMGVVNMPKRHTLHIGHLDLGGGSLVSMDSTGQHYVTVENSSQDNIPLENVMVANSRASQVNGNISNIQHNVASTTPDTYGALEYVSSPVVSLHEDHSNKFSDGLVSVNSVEFVEINDGSMKSSSGSLELYFDVPINQLPTTSTIGNQMSQTATSYHPRHEHQTPKTQLLARAYSDFIQPQEQQQQLLNAQQIHGSSQHSSNDQADGILSNIGPNFVQLEQAVIPQTMNEYRKCGKYESPKRHIQINFQPQKQMIGFHPDTVQIQVDSHNKIIDQSDLHLDLMHHQQESLHTQQEMHHNNLKQHSYIHTTQHLPPKYHLQKQYNQQSRQLESSSLKEEDNNQGIVSQYNHHSRNIQETPVLIANLSSFNDVQLSKSHGVTGQKNDTNSSQNVPLVSRSGRPIRRRPEYTEYVNHGVKEELGLHQSNRSINRSSLPVVKIEINSNPVYDDDDMNDLYEEENDIGISYDEDQDPSEVYSSDGKKFLPHKKRIPKKLKNSKKHVKCYKCSECSEQFINQSQFNLHKQSHALVNKSKLFNCEICTKGFESQLKFFEHLKSHYEPFKKHKCEVCNGEFASADLLQEHSLVHTKEHFKCNICHKTFRKESMLEVHIKVAHLEEETTIITVESPYSCSVCPKSFHSQLTLDTHVQSDHSENLPEFNCEDCYRVFKSKPKLVAHRKAEHKEELGHHGRGSPKKKLKSGKLMKEGFACSLCPRTFTHKNSLIYHIRGHTGERPHQCDQCGKAFYAASALKVHLRLHSGEKPYKCESCGKFFRQWGDLKYHTSSVHSDTRQFQCEFCGKDFKRKYCLVVHRRIHTGEKKYKCEFCQKSFRASSYLQNHKRIHTGERPYPCPDCNKPFRVRSDMKRHRHTHMRDNSCSVHSTSNNVITATTASVGASSCNSPVVTNTSSIIANRQVRQINHSHNQVQILQGHVSHVTSGQLGQLIIADGVPAMIGEQNQPIRIMVSGLAPQQSVTTHTSQPPPAHKHSQVTAVSLSNSLTNLSPGSPSTNSNPTTPSTSGITPDVIIMDESNSQPINLNILPRIITSSGSPGSHTTVVSAPEEYEFTCSNRGTLEMREEGDVCVWSGVHVFTE